MISKIITLQIPFLRNSGAMIHSLEISFWKWQKLQRLDELWQMPDSEYSLPMLEDNDPAQVDAGITVPFSGTAVPGTVGEPLQGDRTPQNSGVQSQNTSILLLMQAIRI